MSSLNERGNRANEAADWFMRLKDDDVSDQDLSRWLEWCAEPENLREFQRTRNTWRSFGQLGPVASEMLETLLEENEPATRPYATDAYSAGAQQAASRWRPMSSGRVAAAVTTLAVAIAGVWYARDAGVGVASNGRSEFARQTTIQSSVLPDGSSLTLAPRTEVAVEFGTDRRKLALSHGEAFFKVHPDKTKPFVVQTSGLSVTAVGTAFDVRSRADRVVVTVQEGIVEVARTGGGAGDNAGSWRVNAGYQVAYDVRTGGARIAAVDAERVLAWRDGRLEYFSEPLESVVADISRYSSRPIEIGDPQLAALTFTGTVFIASIDDWLAAIQATFPVRVVITQDDQVLLLSRSGGMPAHDVH